MVVALEISPLLHERFHDAAPAEPGQPPRLDPHGPRSVLGIAVTAGTAALWQPSDGLTGVVSAGIDYLPFLYRNGGVVGFGGQVGFAAGAASGIHAIVPRLWFAAPAGRLWGAPLAVGLMLRCQMGLADADGCGPQLVLTREDL